MRLLQIHRYHWVHGGAEKIYLEHEQIFKANGWECANFAMSHPNNIESEWQSYFPPEVDFRRRGLRSRWGSISRFIHSDDATINLEHLIQDFTPDIVHIHGLYHQITNSVMRVLRSINVPVVFTAHDYKMTCPAYHLYTPKLGVCTRCFGGRQWNALTHKCLHKSWASSAMYAFAGLKEWWGTEFHNSIHAYIMPSEFIQKAFTDAGLDVDKMHVIRNPVSEGSNITDLPDKISYQEPFSLYCGRLSPEKGCEDFLRAASLLRIKTVFAGEGPEREHLMALAKQLGVDAIFPGHLSAPALNALMDDALCVVVPSIWFENAPMAVLESQIRGRIVCASRIGGIPELIDHNVTGFLFEPNSPESLAEVLKEVSKLSIDERERIGRNARNKCISANSDRVYFQKMNALYLRLIRQISEERSSTRTVGL